MRLFLRKIVRFYMTQLAAIVIKTFTINLELSPIFRFFLSALFFVTATF